ncbi:MAG: hypothetical protein QOD88_33 [Mycobacterium sp.]|jgi:hypothetical protein|nr:hypothetical protein [Mycobacterium sp.]
MVGVPVGQHADGVHRVLVNANVVQEISVTPRASRVG